ncbi:MAG: three-Cys-motif partner protein TcmP [Clostridia bacterium]|nr:three-Cys-motif partner protein TcmP [Clostridia bacterium]
MARTKKVEIITEAKPHTIKKFELIERYVDEWARKILGYNGKTGQDGSKGVIFIDCMCNSGEYRDIDGNYVEGTALRVAKKLNEIILNYPGKEAVLIFNDISSDRVEHLQSLIDNADLENIVVSYNSGDCNTFLKGLDLTTYQQQYNTLLLYDPYNASIDWEAITPFLNRWGEVIINHMVSDTARGASQAKKQQVIERYEETYQNDIASIIEIGNDKERLENIILSIINRKTKRSTAKKYIASFPFFNRTNGLVYNLIHCCASIEGIKLYKKVAWKTFGDKSSTKNTHGPSMQLVIDFDGSGVAQTTTDDSCYYIKDVAKYIYAKYNERGTVSLEEIYNDLDQHPIFPSDGYKNDIKTELRNTYEVSFQRDGKVIFPLK